MKYIEPTVFANSFTCPHCGAISKQDWWSSLWNGSSHPHGQEYNPLRIGTCQHCGKNTLWVQQTMFYPDNGNAPFPVGFPKNRTVFNSNLVTLNLNCHNENKQI